LDISVADLFIAGARLGIFFGRVLYSFKIGAASFLATRLENYFSMSVGIFDKSFL